MLVELLNQLSIVVESYSIRVSRLLTRAGAGTAQSLALVGPSHLQLRIGVALGACLEGVVGGARRPQYDLYGPATVEAHALLRLAQPGDIIVCQSII